MFPCEECSKVLSCQKNLTNHMTIHTENDLQACHICGKLFNMKSNMHQHVKKVHKINDLSQISASEDNSSARKRSADQNEFQSSTTKKRQIDQDEIKCQFCHEIFSSKSVLKAHKQTEHDGTFHPCRYCSFTTKFRSNLVSHIKNRHPESLVD